ncbi:MAG: hypothetical protein PHN42_06180 [Bacilli bacterium]|nr:hypothetical protein [Bacilli bacterium]
MNLVKNYIQFKKNSIINILKIINEEKINEQDEILNSFLNNYIEAYYFHILQTLEKEEIEKYDFKVILKEFDGKRLELIYENKEQTKKIDLLYVLLLISIKLNHLQEINKENVLKTLKQFKFKGNTYTIEELYKMIKENKTKEEKFFKKLEFDYFNLIYKKYKNQNNKYYVSLNYDIKLLSNRYLESSIDKNFNSDVLSVKKFETLLYLVTIDILFRIKNSEELDVIFVDFPSCLLDDDNVKDILNKYYSKYLDKKLTFLVNYNDYLNHKRVLNNLDIKYSFSAYVDMSHINFVENKIDTIESIDLFDFGVLDKVKSKDYEIIAKYESLGKEIFNSEFEKE